MLTLEDILQYMHLNSMEVTKKDFHYYKAEYVENGAELIPEKGVLYIGTPANLKMNDFEFGLITNCKLDLEESEKVLVSNEVCLKEIFRQISEIFCKKIKLDQAILKLFQCVTREQGLEKVIEIVADYIQNPVIVSDASMAKIVSAGPMSNDFIFQPVVATGLYPKEMFIKLKNETWGNLENNCPVYLDKGIFQGKSRYISKLKYQDKIIAWYGVLESHTPFSWDTVIMLKAFGEVIIAILKRKEKTYLKSKEKLLLSLLENENNKYEEWMEYLNWKPIFLVVGYIDLSKDAYLGFNGDYIRNTLCNINHTICVVYQNRIIILFDYKREAEFKFALESIHGVLKELGVSMGLSSVFDNLFFLHRCIEQAKNAYAWWKGEKSKIIFFEDIIFEHLIESYSKKNILDNLCIQSIKQLYKHDKEYGTEYCCTLYQYLQYMRDGKKTAEKMCVHRNTISLRISKVSEISGLSLSDGESCFKAYLALKVLKMKDLI